MLVKKSSQGFTLIELMIAVAIVSVIAAIALPGYQDQVRKTRRGDAEGALMQVRQAMERHYSRNFNYLAAATGGADNGVLGNNSALNINQFIPLDGAQNAAAAYYQISISSAGDATLGGYQLNATPLNGQTNDPCGTLRLQGNGQRLSDGANCWED